MRLLWVFVMGICCVCALKCVVFLLLLCVLIIAVCLLYKCTVYVHITEVCTCISEGPVCECLHV